MTQIDEEARHAAKMAFADAMTKQRIGIGSLDRDDLALVAEKTDAMLESALSAYLTALADKGYVIEQGWQPIETAPSSDETVLVCGGRHRKATAVLADGEYWRANYRMRAIPMYWRYLPEPPLAARDAK